MIARTVEQHSDRSGNYFIAAGEAYGRQIVAEGETRDEAVKSWTQAAAERQAELLGIGKWSDNRRYA